MVFLSGSFPLFLMFTFDLLESFPYVYFETAFLRLFVGWRFSRVIKDKRSLTVWLNRTFTLLTFDFYWPLSLRTWNIIKI